MSKKNLAKHNLFSITALLIKKDKEELQKAQV